MIVNPFRNNSKLKMKFDKRKHIPSGDRKQEQNAELFIPKHWLRKDLFTLFTSTSRRSLNYFTQAF